MTELGGASEEEAWRKIVPAVEALPETSLRAGSAFSPGPCGHGGFLENLREDNMTAGHVFRAMFESMARNYQACAARLDPGRTAARIGFSGGVARRLKALRELTARALGLPGRLSPHPEDTMFGLMVLGAAYSGRQESVGAAARAAAAAPQWREAQAANCGGTSWTRGREIEALPLFCRASRNFEP